MAVPTQLSDLSATAASNSPAGGDTVGTTMDDYIRAIQSIIVRISAGTDAMATPNIGAATGTSLVLSGLATVNGAFTSLGLDDNATAKALTLSGSGANSVTIANSATNPTIGTSAGNLVLSAGGLIGADVAAPASAVNYITLSGSATSNAVNIRPNSTVDTNIGLTLDSKGNGSINFRTDPYGTPAVQAQVLHTASADRYITLTGANAANPKIATSAGSLDIGSPVVFTGQTVGTTVGATGAASALPANPLGYITTAINGTACKIPYYTA